MKIKPLNNRGEEHDLRRTHEKLHYINPVLVISFCNIHKEEKKQNILPPVGFRRRLNILVCCVEYVQHNHERDHLFKNASKVLLGLRQKRGGENKKKRACVAQWSDHQSFDGFPRRR
jgi:hypothetical protein